MTDSGLEVRDITVRYGQAAEPAVRGVTFDVARGEVVALTGPSGCGKSTVLRAIAGLEPLESGSISWAGADLDGDAPHRRGFGLLFQDGQLFAHLTVGQNIAYGLSGRPKAERDARVAELLELVGLSDASKRDVNELSGGVRQRSALSRSL